MMRRHTPSPGRPLRRTASALLAGAALALARAVAQEPAQTAAPAGPSRASLEQLASVLGEAHALNVVCNGDDDQYWRRYMQELMELEAPGGDIRSALTSAFNSGYRAQSSRHEKCTPDLVALQAQVAARGRALTETIARSYVR